MKRLAVVCLGRALALAGLGLAGLVWAPGASLAQGVAEGELIRAAYVYNLAKFTTWPEARRGPEMVLCLAGEDPLAQALAQLQGRKVKGRPIVVRALRGLGRGDDCHILYVATSELGRLERWLGAPRSDGVLSLSTGPGFAEAGGMVELARAGGVTRFKINLEAARRGGLEISPGLLNLAEVVGPVR